MRLDLDAQQGPARVWVQQEPLQREMQYLFRRFLREFEEAGDAVYRGRMRDMCTSARALRLEF